VWRFSKANGVLGCELNGLSDQQRAD
jgi:hypothetical protein